MSLKFDLEKFKTLYEKHNGIYHYISRELGYAHVSGLSLRLTQLELKNKYPSKGSIRNRTLLITEEEFSHLYNKHQGNYSNIGKELSIKNLRQKVLRHDWSSKYPPKGIAEPEIIYEISEEDFAYLYRKFKGLHCSIEEHLYWPQGTISVIRKRKNGKWLEKYPAKGLRKCYFCEATIRRTFILCHGSYPAMAKILNVHPSSLLRYVNKQLWGDKYIIRRIFGTKKQSTGSYQNALCDLIDKIYGNNKTLVDEKSLLAEDINYLFSEGYSEDLIALELNIEKAIVRRYLAQKESVC